MPWIPDFESSARDLRPQMADGQARFTRDPRPPTGDRRRLRNRRSAVHGRRSAVGGHSQLQIVGLSLAVLLLVSGMAALGEAVAPGRAELLAALGLWVAVPLGLTALVFERREV